MRTYEKDRPGKRWFAAEETAAGEVCYYWFNTMSARDQRVTNDPTKRRAVSWAEVARVCGINFASAPIPPEEVAALGEPAPMGIAVDQRRRIKTP